MQAMTGLKGKTATPGEIMCALLKLDVGLIWFGGIGTYVRASNETNAEVGDRTNDAIRVTAAELKAQVIGEGPILPSPSAGGSSSRSRAGASIPTPSTTRPGSIPPTWRSTSRSP
jgi:glutamate dehydrogenase